MSRGLLDTSVLIAFEEDTDPEAMLPEEALLDVRVV